MELFTLTSSEMKIALATKMVTSFELKAGILTIHMVNGTQYTVKSNAETIFNQLIETMKSI